MDRHGMPGNSQQSEKCTICGKDFKPHGITGELTCFEHGNPNGSECERYIFTKHNKQGEPQNELDE